ncbi:MAG: YdbL family protein [Desulfamplus sp.]|nr:YdbL family protein [Desulfamplus sp.]
MSYFNISKNNFIIICGFLLVFINFVSIKNCMADEIKDRMKQRLPIIVEMKQKGIIGENSRGYLEFVSGNKVNQEIVESENRDRKEVYSAIAKEQGVPIEKVEQLRASQIVQKAVSGEFLKKEDGPWYKK